MGALPPQSLQCAHLLSKEFLGANIFDDNPFIVMPLFSKGNARDYVQTHPKCNRVRLVSVIHHIGRTLPPEFSLELHEVSLGMVYLHSQNVTHGDVKAVR